MTRFAVAAAAMMATAALFADKPGEIPPLLKTAGGAAVATVGEWERVRRPEILKTFETQVFGVRPVERPETLRFETLIEHRDALLSSAVLKRVKVSWSGVRGGQAYGAHAPHFFL